MPNLQPQVKQEQMSLKALFEPQSVAIVGASSNPARIGGRPIAYYLAAGFKGGLYPVNPNRDQVQGLKAYPDIASIPVPVDLAILAITANTVVDTIQACGEKGVKAIILFSSGFSELILDFMELSGTPNLMNFIRF